MIHLDTSALVAALTGPRTAAPTLRLFVRDGMRLGVSTLVLYEWWRGPRTEDELRDQELLLPRGAAFGFGVDEALAAAKLYRQLRQPRHREIDLAIAACAIVQRAAFWTLNPQDFRDIPGLELAADPRPTAART
jgi:predicted nucleic acid-binding protein